MGYICEKVNEYTYHIDGLGRESMYLIIGEKKALMIDTGMEKDSLSDYVKTLTDKPVAVALTHGHFDHIGRCGDFEEVYIDEKDIDMYIEHSNIKGWGIDVNTLNILDVNKVKPLPQSFDLGGVVIDVVPLAGHTPGSVLFVDRAAQLVYSGDAIGSGCGVLMLIKGALTISEYRDALLQADKDLKELGVDSSWQFYGGHNGQQHVSRVSEFNRLDLTLLEDMAVLCEKLLDGCLLYTSPSPRDS